MQKIEENGFIATITKNKIKIEMSISNLEYAFNNSPNNYSEDGENFIKVKRGKRQEFAQYVAEQLLLSEDPDTGDSLLVQAIEKVFEQVFESDEEFAKFPGYDEED
jgi:hypothetical protein